jgi:hypothetical protein
MGIVETQSDHAELCVDVSAIALTPTERFLLSSVPARDCVASTYHVSDAWVSQGRRIRPQEDVATHVLTLVHARQENLPMRRFSLKLYEGVEPCRNVIAAVVDGQSGLPLQFVYVIWNKAKLEVSNQGFGLGSEPGSYRFDGMRMVL